MSNVEGWTTARYWSFIRSALRRAWNKYPPKYKVLNAAKRKRQQKKGNQKYEYKCASCGRWHAGKNVSVDHISPAGSLRDYNDLPTFVAKLFCSVEGLQVLCTRCHAKKTNEERGIIPEVAEFKKLNAEGQKKKLKKLGLEDGSNAEKRIGIFEAYIEEKGK